MLQEIAVNILKFGLKIFPLGFFFMMLWFYIGPNSNKMSEAFGKKSRAWYREHPWGEKLLEIKFPTIFYFLFHILFFLGFPASCLLFIAFGQATTVPGEIYQVTSVNLVTFFLFFIPYNIIHQMFSPNSLVYTVLTKKLYNKDMYRLGNEKFEKDRERMREREMKQSIERQKKRDEAEVLAMEKEYYRRKLEEMDRSNLD